MTIRIVREGFLIFLTPLIRHIEGIQRILVKWIILLLAWKNQGLFSEDR